MSEGSPGPQHGGPWKVELDLIIQGRVFIRLMLFLNVIRRLGHFLVVKAQCPSSFPFWCLKVFGRGTQHVSVDE